MKIKYQEAGVPTARCHRVGTIEDLREFVKLVGYPVIAKPENGVGAADTYKIANDEELEQFYEVHHGEYVCEEFITGDIVSYSFIWNSFS